MPHSGDGSSQNGPFEEAGHPIIHGTEKGSNVDRSDKSAPLPEGMNEHGAGLEGMNASGGQSQGIKRGPDVGQGGGAK